MIIIDDVFDAHAAHDNHETVSESTCLLARARDRSEEAALDNLVLFYCPSTFIAHGELLRHYRRHLSEPSEAKQGDSCARNGHARGSHAGDSRTGITSTNPTGHRVSRRIIPCKATSRPPEPTTSSINELARF